MSLVSLLASVDRNWKRMYAVCGLRTCQNKLLMRSVPQSRVGIRMGEFWYCSIDCFVKAARTRFSSLSDRRTLEMPHSPRLSIGLVMLSKGTLTDEQYRFALAQSQSSGEDLEAVLVRLGFADEWQLALARAAQWGYPVLGRDRISQSIDIEIPITLLQLFSAVPLHYSNDAGRLLLGFVYRVEHGFLHSLEQIAGCKVEPCFITPTEFHYQMDRLTNAQNHREILLEESMMPAEMANVVGRFALEVAAREANLATCQDYLWLRLSGKRRMVDVLFRTKSQAEAQRCQDFGSGDKRVASLR